MQNRCDDNTTRTMQSYLSESNTWKGFGDQTIATQNLGKQIPGIYPTQHTLGPFPVCPRIQQSHLSDNFAMVLHFSFEFTFTNPPEQGQPTHRTLCMKLSSNLRRWSDDTSVSANATQRCEISRQISCRQRSHSGEARLTHPRAHTSSIVASKT